MADSRREVPVTADHLGVRVIVSENAVLHPGSPDAAFLLFPAGQRFRACDDGAEWFFGTVHDPGVLASGVPGRDLFPVNSGRDDDFVAGNSNPGRVVNVPEGALFGPVPVALRTCVYIINHAVYSLSE